MNKPNEMTFTMSIKDSIEFHIKTPNVTVTQSRRDPNQYLIYQGDETVGNVQVVQDDIGISYFVNVFFMEGDERAWTKISKTYGGEYGHRDTGKWIDRFLASTEGSVNPFAKK